MTRSFDTRPLALDQITGLLDLARRAPSAGFSQGTHFMVLTEHSLERFWQVTGAHQWFAGRQPGVLAAPVVVLPLADPNAYTSRYSATDKAGHGLQDAANWPVPYWVADTAMATQNLLLLAEEAGLGALLFGIFRNEAPLLAELEVPDGVRPIGAVALGHRAADDHPSGSPTRRPRRPASETIHLHRW